MQPQKSELLLKLYEVNEKYHNEKDAKAWIAASLYATYAVGLFFWVSGQSATNALIALTVLCVHVVFSASAFFYVFFQFQMKSMSLESEKELAGQLSMVFNANVRRLKNPRNRRPVRFDKLPIYLILLMLSTIGLLMLLRLLSNQPTISLARVAIYLLICVLVGLMSVSVLLSFIVLIPLQLSSDRQSNKRNEGYHAPRTRSPDIAVQ